MRFLEDAKTILTEVLTLRKPFYSVFKEFLRTNVRTLKECDMIRTIYLVFFKKFYYYEKLTEVCLGKITKVLVAYIGVSFISCKYLSTEVKDASEFLIYGLRKNKAYSDEIEKQIVHLLHSTAEGKEVELPPETDPVRKLSLFFNLPTWFIKMMINQKGEAKAKQVFESFLSRYNHEYTRNELVKDDEFDFSLKNEFTRISNGNYVTENKNSPLITNYAFVETYPFYKDIISMIGSCNNKYITYYFSDNNNFFFELLNVTLNRYNLINFGIDTLKNNALLYNAVMKKNIPNFDVNELTESQMIVKLSYQQDYVFYCPKSSNFMEYYINPESRVIFDTMTLDSIIKNQLKGLSELTRYCANGSKLIYFVNTVDIKETEEIVGNFIKLHNNFDLISTNEYLPNKETKQLGYCAIFKKVRDE